MQHCDYPILVLIDGSLPDLLEEALPPAYGVYTRPSPQIVPSVLVADPGREDLYAVISDIFRADPDRPPKLLALSNRPESLPAFNMQFPVDAFLSPDLSIFHMAAVIEALNLARELHFWWVPHFYNNLFHGLIQDHWSGESEYLLIPQLLYHGTALPTAIYADLDGAPLTLEYGRFGMDDEVKALLQNPGADGRGHLFRTTTGGSSVDIHILRLCRYDRLFLNLAVQVPVGHAGESTYVADAFMRHVAPALQDVVRQSRMLLTARDMGRMEQFVGNAYQIAGALQQPDESADAFDPIEDLPGILDHRAGYCEILTELEPFHALGKENHLDLSSLWADATDIHDDATLTLRLDAPIPYNSYLSDFIEETFRLFHLSAQEQERAPHVSVTAGHDPEDLVVVIRDHGPRLSSVRRNAWFDGFCEESPSLQLFEMRIALKQMGCAVRDISSDETEGNVLEVRIPLKPARGGRS